MLTCKWSTLHTQCMYYILNMVLILCVVYMYMCVCEWHMSHVVLVAQ